MATLEKIRSRAALTIVVIGIALLAFIVGDALNSGSSFFKQSQQKIGIIKGDVLTVPDYQAQIEEMTQVYKMQTGQESLPNEYYTQIQQSVWENFVRKSIFSQQADQIGLSVSSEELFDNVSGNHINPIVQQMPMFRDPQTGVFNKAALLQFLQTIEGYNPNVPAEAQEQIAQYKKFWLFWEKTIKEQILEDKYNNLLVKAMSANSLDAKSAFQARNTQYEFTYVKQPYSSIVDSTVAVSDKEIKARYEKEKDNYKQEETRQVSYITIDIKPSQEDYNTISDEINKLAEKMADADAYMDVVASNSDVPFVDAYQAVRNFDPTAKEFLSSAASGAVFGPYFFNETYKMYRLIDKTTQADSVKASQIFIPQGDETRVKTIADSLMNVLKSGKDFAALAQETSADRSAQNGGDMGWFTQEAAAKGIGKDFAVQCFALPLNTPQVIKSNYGTHIIKITEKTAPVSKVKVAALEIKVTPQPRTITHLYNNLSRFISQNTEVKGWQEAATKEGLMVQKNENVSAQMYNFGSMDNSRSVIRWIFNAKKGDVSEIFEVDNQFLVVALDGIEKKGFQSLEKLQPVLKAQIIAQKKGTMIAEQWKARSAQNLQALATNLNTTIDTAKFVTFATRYIDRIGFEPAVLGALATAKQGELTSPLIGKNAVYGISMVKTEKLPEELNVQNEIKTINNGLLYRLRYQSFEALRDKIDVEDSRVRFF